jgi:uncharacterized tellurite resistance protein B-like protein
MSNMSPVENLHYALGELAYAIARADGQVQEPERKKFHDIVAAEIRCGDCDFDLSDIIFQVMDKEDLDANTAYEWAMREIRLNSHYLSPEMKKTFICVMEKVAKAYPPIATNERTIIERFRKDMEPINGDPVYYFHPDRHILPKHN